MSKRIEKDGKFYRMRRGKLVEIPTEWVGKTVFEQTKRKRKANKAWDRKRRNNKVNINEVET